MTFLSCHSQISMTSHYPVLAQAMINAVDNHLNSHSLAAACCQAVFERQPAHTSSETDSASQVLSRLMPDRQGSSRARHGPHRRRHRCDGTGDGTTALW